MKMIKMDFTQGRAWTQKFITHFKRLSLLQNDCLFCHYSTKSSSLLCEVCLQDIECFPLGYDLLIHNPKASKDIFHKFIDGINILAPYSAPFDRVIPQLKFHQQLTHAKWLGTLIKASLQHTQWIKYDVIVPIPLHPKRMATRGYNQAEVSSRFIDKNKLENRCLKRVKHTNAQTQLSRKQRIQNLKNAFVCQQDLSGKCVLLVDDVLTTGSTLNEAANVLKQAGATTVYVAVVAIKTLD